MALADLWISGARDVFGYRFRDAWHINGWEEGCVPERFVCWLPSTPAQLAMVKPNTPQLELFA